MGSPVTIALPAAPPREIEIVPPTGDSHETSSVPACVTIVDGTTAFCTPPLSVVHADAAGAKASAAITTAETRICSAHVNAPFTRGQAASARAPGRSPVRFGRARRGLRWGT